MGTHFTRKEQEMKRSGNLIVATAAAALVSLCAWAAAPVTAVHLPGQNGQGRIGVKGIPSSAAATPRPRVPSPSFETHKASAPQALAAASMSVLIVQNEWPWGKTADTDVLSSIGYSYTIVDTATFDGMSASAVQAYDIVLIASDQFDAFNTWFNANLARFSQYAQAGGALIVFAGTNSSVSTTLPGGLQYLSPYTSGYSNHDYIVDATDPIVTDVLSQGVPLTDADLYGNACSHGWFVENTLPAGADVVLREADYGGHPTLIRYSLGAGSVIASCQTWEWAYSHCGEFNFSCKALDDVFLSAAGFNLAFLDDAGASEACANSHTGRFQWAVLSGPYTGTTFNGALNVYNGGTMFWSQAGASQYVYIYYDPNNHTAWGYLYDYTTGLYSSLFDSNTLNDPATCGTSQPPV